MPSAGTSTIDFGAGNNITTLTVTGQTGILTGSNVEAFLMGDSSADHTVYEHNMAPIQLRCGNIVVGASFDIVATSFFMALTGQWTVRWIWA